MCAGSFDLPKYTYVEFVWVFTFRAQGLPLYQENSGFRVSANTNGQSKENSGSSVDPVETMQSFISVQMVITSANNTPSFVFMAAITSRGDVNLTCSRPTRQANLSEDISLTKGVPPDVTMVMGTILLVFGLLALVAGLLVLCRTRPEWSKILMKREKVEETPVTTIRNPCYEESTRKPDSGYFRYSDPFDHRNTLANTSELTLDKVDNVQRHPQPPPRARKDSKAATSQGGSATRPLSRDTHETSRGKANYLSALSHSVQDEYNVSDDYEDYSTIEMVDEEVKLHQKAEALRQMSLESNRHVERHEESASQQDGQLQPPTIVRLHRKESDVKNSDKQALSQQEETDTADLNLYASADDDEEEGDVRLTPDPSLGIVSDLSKMVSSSPEKIASYENTDIHGQARCGAFPDARIYGEGSATPILSLVMHQQRRGCPRDAPADDESGIYGAGSETSLPNYEPDSKHSCFEFSHLPEKTQGTQEDSDLELYGPMSGTPLPDSATAKQTATVHYTQVRKEPRVGIESSEEGSTSVYSYTKLHDTTTQTDQAESDVYGACSGTPAPVSGGGSVDDPITPEVRTDNSHGSDSSTASGTLSSTSSHGCVRPALEIIPTRAEQRANSSDEAENPNTRDIGDCQGTGNTSTSGSRRLEDDNRHIETALDCRTPSPRADKGVENSSISADSNQNRERYTPTCEVIEGKHGNGPKNFNDNARFVPIHNNSSSSSKYINVNNNINELNNGREVQRGHDDNTCTEEDHVYESYTEQPKEGY
ncbi:hypothetical protein PoB_003008800 [Plakobranchus ocellatus]|uniref:Uncharacterized protein n=1 Tax=Plakobranchus ocellatus TaxID=259542 RepID=A0AAV4AAA9_9GAST|nr:hypothetical protein PoB_003008800 [Plakobranchus ocellatus]